MHAGATGSRPARHIPSDATQPGSAAVGPSGPPTRRQAHRREFMQERRIRDLFIQERRFRELMHVGATGSRPAPHTLGCNAAGQRSGRAFRPSYAQASASLRVHAGATGSRPFHSGATISRAHACRSDGSRDRRHIPSDVTQPRSAAVGPSGPPTHRQAHRCEGAGRLKRRRRGADIGDARALKRARPGAHTIDLAPTASALTIGLRPSLRRVP